MVIKTWILFLKRTLLGQLSKLEYGWYINIIVWKKSPLGPHFIQNKSPHTVYKTLPDLPSWLFPYHSHLVYFLTSARPPQSWSNLGRVPPQGLHSSCLLPSLTASGLHPNVPLSMRPTLATLSKILPTLPKHMYFIIPFPYHHLTTYLAKRGGPLVCSVHCYSLRA